MVAGKSRSDNSSVCGQHALCRLTKLQFGAKLDQLVRTDTTHMSHTSHTNCTSRTSRTSRTSYSSYTSYIRGDKLALQVEASLQTRKHVIRSATLLERCHEDWTALGRGHSPERGVAWIRLLIDPYLLKSISIDIISDKNGPKLPKQL